MSWQDAPLYVRAHDVAVDLHGRSEGWSAAHQAGIGRVLLDTSTDLLCAVSLALAFPVERPGHQQRADHALQRLRVLLRVAEATGVLSEGAALHLQSELLDMGRMLGGWRKREARKQHAASNNSPA